MENKKKIRKTNIFNRYQQQLANKQLKIQTNQKQSISPRQHLSTADVSSITPMSAYPFKKQTNRFSIGGAPKQPGTTY